MDLDGQFTEPAERPDPATAAEIRMALEAVCNGDGTPSPLGLSIRDAAESISSWFSPTHTGAGKKAGFLLEIMKR